MIVPVTELRRASGRPRGARCERGVVGGLSGLAGHRSGDPDCPPPSLGSFRTCRHPCGCTAATKQANFEVEKRDFHFPIRSVNCHDG